MKNIFCNVFLILTIILLSFRFIWPGVICALLYLIYYLSYNKVTNYSLMICVAGVIFYLLFSLLAINNYELGAIKFISLATIFCVTNILFFILGQDYNKKYKYLLLWGWCNLIYVVTVSLYSFSQGYLGYADIYDFYAREHVNSPQFAMLILISTVFIIEFSDIGRNRKYLLIFTLILISCIYLQSRAALVIVIGYVFFKLISQLGIFKTILLILLFSFLGHAFINVILTQLDFGITERILNRGLESSRYKLLTFGFQHISDFPFGGLKAINAGSTYNGVWFHNIYLDITRLAGYYFMFIWVVFQIAIFLLSLILYRTNASLAKKCITIYLILFVIYFQDLSFDGFYNIMAYLFIVFGIFIRGLDDARRTKLSYSCNSNP